MKFAVCVHPGHKVGRSPCGERGLKWQDVQPPGVLMGRSPCGERGLKWMPIASSICRCAVAPRAGSVD